jgi:hypothetical protein
VVKAKLVPIDDLRPSAYNPRKADAERLNLVELSLRKFGWLLPIYADANGEILSGHQRHLVASRMGAKMVPVVRTPVMQIERRMGINVLYNRATNDLYKNQSSTDMKESLFSMGGVIEKINMLPDIEVDTPEWYPVLKTKPVSVLRLMKLNDRWLEQHAIVMSGQMKSNGLPPMPVICTPELEVLNGKARLTYAASEGADFVDIVTVPSGVSEEVKAMLNLLSMDFDIQERYADLLRHNSFRRKNQRVEILTPTFLEDFLRHFVPSGNRNAAFHLSDPKHIELWKQYYGTTVVDFGAGLCDKTDILNRIGVDCTPFEPFFLAKDNETIDTEGARALVGRFLKRVEDGTVFDSIFIASVFNSIPFLQDRIHVVKIVASLCSEHTKLHTAAICTESDRWHNHARGDVKKGHDTSSGGFPLDYEPRIIVSDIAQKPKVQKYHTQTEFKELISHGFKSVDTFLTAKNGLVQAVGSNARTIPTDELRAAIEFEFNLPHPNGLRLDMAEEALKAFSKRLGVDL